MSIISLLKKVETHLKSHEINLAFNIIKKIKNEYPKNKGLKDFFEQNNYKYKRKMKTSMDEINELYKSLKSSISFEKVNSFLKNDNQNAYLYSFCGSLYGNEKNFSKAIMFQEKAIFLNPFEIVFYINLSRTHEFVGNYEFSKKMLENILMVNEDDADVLLLHARISFRLLKYIESFSSYEKLISMSNNQFLLEHKIEYCENLLNAGNITKAKEIINLLELSDEKGKEFYHLKGVFELNEKNYSKAKQYFLKCIEIDKNYSNAFTSLGVVYDRLYDFDEAIKLHKKSISLDNLNSKAYNNLGIMYSYLGKIDESIPLMEKAIELNPHNNESKYILGQLQIYNKNYISGWRNFESRWLYINYQHKKHDTKKNWITKLDDKSRILLWAEQGIGDQIMYATMFNEFSSFSKNLLIKIDKRLIEILEKKHPLIKFVPKEKIISDEEFDCHMPFGDLGKFLRKDIKDFKKTKFPFISADKNLSNSIKDKFLNNKKFLVGISWTSYNQQLGHDKSVYLENLIPILKINNISFIDLEYRNSDLERKNLFDKYNLTIYKEDKIDSFNDIKGLTSIIEACDFVITCSNINAHLSGALGIKTFLLLPLGKGRLWNWNFENQRSIWYPSVKIFQQETQGKWKDPILKLEKEVKKCLNA